MKKLALALAATVSVVASAPSAYAEQDAPPTASAKAESPTTTTRWYGYQTMAADGAALALGIASAATEGAGTRNGLGAAAFAAYAIVPGIIHAFHGHIARGAGDIAFRVLGPLVTAGVGVLVGMAVGPSSQDSTPAAHAAGSVDPATIGGVIGLLGGAVVASVFDAAVLARETSDLPRPSGKQAATTITPGAAPTKNGFSAGLVGTF